MLVEEIDRNGNSLIDRAQFAASDHANRRAVGSRADVHATSAGRIAQITDPLGRVVRYAYNGGRRLETVTDAAGGTTRYTYDAPAAS